MTRRRNERGDIVGNLVWALAVVVALAVVLRLAFGIDLIHYLAAATDWIERKF